MKEGSAPDCSKSCQLNKTNRETIRTIVRQRKTKRVPSDTVFSYTNTTLLGPKRDYGQQLVLEHRNIKATFRDPLRENNPTKRGSTDQREDGFHCSTGKTGSTAGRCTLEHDGRYNGPVLCIFTLVHCLWVNGLNGTDRK